MHKKFGIAESSLGKVISGRQYKGGKEIGEYVLDEEQIEIEDDIELEPVEGTSGLEPVLKKGTGKKPNRKRPASEIRKDQQKKKQRKDDDDDEDETEKGPLKPAVTAGRGPVILEH